MADIALPNQGSNSVAVNDLEPTAVGTYDDTILHLVDQLMLECSARGTLPSCPAQLTTH